MKYMPILPIGMFDINNNTDAFILPQYWYLEEYANFYRTNAWNTVIIDNAMYEQKDMFDFQSMINISKMLNAKRIFLVVPEDHSNPFNTVTLAVNCISDYPPNGWDPMVIVHGSIKEVETQIKQLRGIKNIGFGIAVSLWRAGFKREAIYRSNKLSSHYVHAMGLDDIDEITFLRMAGFNSVDSSIVATAAWNNINLQKDRQIVRNGGLNDPERVKLTQPVFSLVMKNVAARNIALINQLCEG